MSRRPDPLVWAEALKQAAGDARRLKLLDDGTVLVLRSTELTRPLQNHPNDSPDRDAVGVWLSSSSRWQRPLLTGGVDR